MRGATTTQERGQEDRRKLRDAAGEKREVDTSLYLSKSQFILQVEAEKNYIRALKTLDICKHPISLDILFLGGGKVITGYTY